MDNSVLVEEAWLPPGADRPTPPTLWAFDLGTSTWSGKPNLTPATFDPDAVTDGTSVATVQQGADGVNVLTVWRDGGFSTSTRLPATFWSDALPPVPLPSGDGYMLPLARSLILVDDDGLPEPVVDLPSGFVTLAPTNNPDRFLITPTGDVQEQSSGLAPVPIAGAAIVPGSHAMRLYLWNRIDDTVTFVMANAAAVSRSKSGLALVRTVRGGCWRIESNGTRTRLAPPTSSGAVMSPGGSFIAEPAAACADDPAIAVCEILVRRADNGSEVGSGPGPAAGMTWWRGTLAYLELQPEPWHAAALIIISGRHGIQFLFP